MDRIGRYNGVDYWQQRVCDVFSVKVRARWYFAYIDGKATGDHFKTLADFRACVDSGHFNELSS